MSSQNPRGHQPFILTALREGPKTQRGIRRKYERLLHYMGLPVNFASDDRGSRFHVELQENLASLVKKGLVVEEDSTYSLTRAGTEAAESAYQRAREQEDRFTTFVHSPPVASKLSVLASAMLAVLKLSTGVTFHSLALVADGMDSLLDALSSSIVLLGVRVGREAASAVFLLGTMGIVGLYVFVESIQRLTSGTIVEASTAAFVAAGVSGAVSYVMGFYQKRVGTRVGSLALVSQSQDSRNHAIQAIAVFAGLGMARTGVHFMDSFVAFVIGVSLLLSAVELALELRRSVRLRRLDGNATSRSEGTFDKHRWNFFKTWTLMTLKRSPSRRELVLRYDEAFTPDDLPYATHRSPSAGFDYRKNVDGILQELFEEGLIASHGAGLYLTEQGKTNLGRRLRRRRFGFSS